MHSFKMTKGYVWTTASFTLCMDDSFIHQLQLSAYSCFERDRKGVVHYGFVHTSASAHRTTMVHAATKYGPHVTLDVGGFPILEDSSNPLANGGGLEGSGNLWEVRTADFLSTEAHQGGLWLSWRYE